MTAYSDVGEDSTVLLLDVQPSYSAEVFIDLASSPALDADRMMLQGGFPVLLRGRVLYDPSTVQLALFEVLVWVDVTAVTGTRVRRTLTALASVQSAGAFRVFFTPKQLEGGIYTIGAMHPALAEADVPGSVAQANFSVAVLTTSEGGVFPEGGGVGGGEPVRVNFFLPELLLSGAGATTSLEPALVLDNRGDTPFSGMRVETVSWQQAAAAGMGLPAQLASLEVFTEMEIPGRVSVPVNVTYRAVASFFGAVTLRFSSNEGLIWDVFPDLRGQGAQCCPAGPSCICDRPSTARVTDHFAADHNKQCGLCSSSELDSGAPSRSNPRPCCCGRL